jgi:hypothetical protein
MARSFLHSISVDFPSRNRYGHGKDTSTLPWPLKQIVIVILKLSRKSTLKVRVLRDFNNRFPLQGGSVADQEKQEQSAVSLAGTKSLVPMRGIGRSES